MTQPPPTPADTSGMSTDPLLIHLWLSALRAIGGFDLTIAIRDVELVYRVAPRARA